ncbi:hypothetical protein INT45_012463 [Circinella minor]|uniref:Uncharacterized protein n=1 Tax=Circinella minor TaxID=1195481 RepID=A0A8H7VN66_9FUNG|nr:hypothetical protein INT45_012463 [Circinella minor]
MKIVKLGSNIH